MTRSQLEVRPATSADRERIAGISAAAPESAHWLPGDGDETYVAVRERTVVGFVVVRRTAPGEAEVLNLAVAQEARRQGVASTLLRVVFQEYRGSVYLEVRESNRAARIFYQVQGFQQVGVRQRYYRHPEESAVVMKWASC